MAKTKQCRDCKAEIPKSAKKCMHCGSKQGSGFLSNMIFIIIGSSAVAYCSMQQTEYEKQAQNQTSAKQAQSKPEKTPEQIKADAQRDKSNREKESASSLCMQAVRANAKFPSSVDFSIMSSPPSQPIAGGGWRIQWAFESKNGLGNMIPQMARCDVINGKLTSFNVSNR